MPCQLFSGGKSYPWLNLWEHYGWIELLHLTCDGKGLLAFGAHGLDLPPLLVEEDDR